MKIKMEKQNSIEDWINVPAVLEALGKKIEGTVKFGIRLPMKPGTVPLEENNNKFNGLKGDYWFVNEDQSIKVKLLTYKTNEDEIQGYGYDIEKFEYKLRKENGKDNN